MNGTHWKMQDHESMKGDVEVGEDSSWLEKFLSQFQDKNVSGEVTWYNETLLYFTFGFKAKISVGSFGKMKAKSISWSSLPPCWAAALEGTGGDKV